jgi:hypothetical protein
MRVPGHDGVWALGDAALIPLVDDPDDDPMLYATQTAQFAEREGRQLAANIVARMNGKELKPFAHTSKGSLASLGMSKAVADVYGIKLSGTLAWLLWRGFYLSFLPGFQAKLRVGINWLVNSVMPPNIVQIQSNPPATRYIHYRKGDRVFEPGMIIDGFYTVVKGSFRLIIDNPETGEQATILASVCCFAPRSGPGLWWRSRIRSCCSSRRRRSPGSPAPSRSSMPISRNISSALSAATTRPLPPARPTTRPSSRHCLRLGLNLRRG